MQRAPSARPGPGRTVGLAGTAALAVLLAAAPRPVAALATVRDPGAAPDLTAPVLALVALAAWALTGWLALVVAATLLGRVPGGVGAASRRAVRRLAPGAVRRTVELALGLAVTATVTATAVGAGPAAAATDGPAPAPPGVSLDWPGTPPAPDLDWPATGSGQTTEVGAGQVPAEPAAPAATGPTEPVEPVVVRPGDSLWHLAERDLAWRTGTGPSDAQTAAAWPAWWAANRDAVGPDPDLVHPGTALVPPPDLPLAASPSDDA